MKNILKSSRHLIKPVGSRSFGSTQVSLPKLPYELSGLEPVISGKMMDYHFNKHHKTYVDNLNAKSKEAEEAIGKGDTRKLVSLT